MTPLRTQFFYNILCLAIFSVILYVLSTQILYRSDSRKYIPLKIPNRASINKLEDGHFSMKLKDGSNANNVPTVDRNDAKEDFDDMIDLDKPEEQDEKIGKNIFGKYVETQRPNFEGTSKENLEDEKPNWLKLFSV